jgi:hypothetical protein
MDKTTARKIADGLTWARIWSATPITVFLLGTLGKAQITRYILFGTTSPATEQSGA